MSVVEFAMPSRPPDKPPLPKGTSPVVPNVPLDGIHPANAPQYAPESPAPTGKPGEFPVPFSQVGKGKPPSVPIAPTVPTFPADQGIYLNPDDLKHMSSLSKFAIVLDFRAARMSIRAAKLLIYEQLACRVVVRSRKNGAYMIAAFFKESDMDKALETIVSTPDGKIIPKRKALKLPKNYRLVRILDLPVYPEEETEAAIKACPEFQGQRSYPSSTNTTLAHTDLKTR